MSTTETRSADIEVLDERGKLGSDPQQPATTFSEQVQDAIDSGADLDWIQRRFHLSESELRDYCADIMYDGFDADWPEADIEGAG